MNYFYDNRTGALFEEGENVALAVAFWRDTEEITQPITESLTYKPFSNKQFDMYQFWMREPYTRRWVRRWRRHFINRYTQYVWEPLR